MTNKERVVNAKLHKKYVSRVWHFDFFYWLYLLKKFLSLQCFRLKWNRFWFSGTIKIYTNSTSTKLFWMKIPNILHKHFTGTQYIIKKLIIEVDVFAKNRLLKQIIFQCVFCFSNTLNTILTSFVNDNFHRIVWFSHQRWSLVMQLFFKFCLYFSGCLFDDRKLLDSNL